DVFGDNVADHFEMVWNAVVTVFELFRDVFLGLWRALDAVFRGDWETAWEEVKQVFWRVWDALPGIVEGALNGIFGLVDALARSIISIIRDIWGDDVANVFEAAWDTVTIIFETA